MKRAFLFLQSLLLMLVFSSCIVYDKAAPSIGNSVAPKYFKANLPLSMTPQTGKTCLPSIMAFANQQVCHGKNYDYNYIDRYETNHPDINVVEDGISGTAEDLVDFINANFKTQFYQSAGGVIKCIDAGYPILTTILCTDNDGNTKLHAVLVIGYDMSNKTNPRLYYMNPVDGRVWNNMRMFDFSKSCPAYALAITGCR